LVGKKCLILVDGRKKENTLDVWGSFERMEVSGNKYRELEILGKLYKPSRV
jgi:hypothetical protein